MAYKFQQGVTQLSGTTTFEQQLIAPTLSASAAVDAGSLDINNGAATIGSDGSISAGAIGATSLSASTVIQGAQLVVNNGALTVNGAGNLSLPATL
jgi:hypothetical protein